jgi:hypothetical protein
MIIDCFTFYSGMDVLEIRLNSLAPYVDRFILVESPYDMVGKNKPLYFADNKERFKDFPISHLVVPDHEKHMGGWTPYYYQIDYMLTALERVDPEAIILLSDFDEIPNLADYRGGEEGFRQRNYCYYLNVFTGGRTWKGTVARYRKNIRRLSWIRKGRGRYPGVTRNGGWHFSYVMTPEEIVEKIEAFCHQELNTQEVKDRVRENKENLVDPFNRGDGHTFVVEMPSGPEWLLKNKERYAHLFYGGIQ